MAQTPPPKPATPPQPTITMSMQPPPSVPTLVVPPEKVVIAVGEQKITYAQFESIINSLPEQYRVQARGPGRKQFADNLVRVLVLSEEGKRRKLDASDSYKTQAQFQAANVLAGLTFEQITKEAKIEEADLRKYYAEHPAEFEQVHARHILVRMQGSPVPVKPGEKDLSDAEALAKAQELRKKLAAGADFATLAITESDDQGSGAKGGDLGFFHKNQMVPSFEQAAFAMKPGELSEPVKSQFGYHLIKVEAHETKTFDEARPDLEKHMGPEAAQRAMQALERRSAVTLDPDFFGPAATPGPPPAPPAVK